MRLAWVAWICTLGYYGSEWGERLKPVWSGMHRATWIAVAAALVVGIAGKLFMRRRAAASSQE